VSSFLKAVPFGISVALVSVLIASPSQAFMGECYIALDTKSFEDQADKPKITVQDGVYHQPMTIDFQGKTLRTIRPGDTVEAHGEQHVLMEVEQRANYSRYTFASEDDVARYHAALSGESVEQHVGVQDLGVQEDGVEKVGVQDVGVQDVGVQDDGVEKVGVQDDGVQHGDGVEHGGGGGDHK
jgi:hypothetical protein